MRFKVILISLIDATRERENEKEEEKERQSQVNYNVYILADCLLTGDDSLHTIPYHSKSNKQ